MDFNELMLQLQMMMASNIYISATVILIVFFILSKLVIMIAEKIFLRLAARTATDLDDKIIKAVNRPISLLILLIGFRIFFLEIWKAYSFEQYIQHTIDTIMIVIVTATFVKVVDLVLSRLGENWAKKTKSHLDDQLIRLGHQFSMILLWIFAFLAVLAAWGIQIGPLLAGLGIGGIAIAFALQSTLANVFGGISLILDKTIKVGDIVKLDGGESGEVYDIGIRSTSVRTWNNEILVVPNGKLVDSKIINYNQPNRRVRVDIIFGVAYGSKIDKVKKVALDCLKGEKYVLKDPAPNVWFTDMGDSSLNFKLMFHVDDLSNKWTTHQSVITKLYDSLNKQKINIPFPQRELWVHNVKKK